MFLLKKIIGPLLLPLSLCLEILLLGIFLLWFTRKQKAGKIAVTIGIVLLVVFSYGSISDVCLRPLEYKYSPLMDFQAFSDVKWIVVLGGGHTSDPKLPVTGQIGDSSLFRLLEGIRIHRKLPESKLILSGSGVYDPVSDAQIMADVSYVLGVNNDKLVLEELSKDTK
ncbi:MAG: ElyC/SanA/YdcF family protein, partial [Thermodesulfobacteriota bacterium]|nr:ElyC/SanA/YdcF family protein [Thermodesulfobacteriota bacterium]